MNPAKQLCAIDELSSDERKSLLKIASGLDRVALILIMETGLSIDEISEIRPSDFDPDLRSVSASGRMFILSREGADEIAAYLLSRPAISHIIEGRCGKPLTPRWERCVIGGLIKRARALDKGKEPKAQNM